jgi:hypothetical protein
MKVTPSFEKVVEVIRKKNYKFFDNDSKPYNLNIIGIRTNDIEANTFNDWLYVIWKFQGSLEGIKFRVTTDPGLYYRKNPMNPAGTAIVKPGQYPNMWTVGKHKGVYAALVQVGDCVVIRDFDRDHYLDYSSGREEKGIFQINCHRAIENGRSIMVEKWSAGCTVFADYYEFEIFMRLVSEGVKNWTPAFTYTLLTELDFQ